MKTMRAWSALCVVLGVGCFAPQVPKPNDLAHMEVEVLEAVQATMDGLAAHDSIVLSERVLPDAVIQRWQADSAGVWKTVTLTGAEFVSRLGQPGPAFLERTWREAVLDGDVASVTAFLGGRRVFALRGRRPDIGSRRQRCLARGDHFVHRQRAGEQACRGRFPDMPLSPKSATR